MTIPGPPASVLAAVLRADPSHPYDATAPRQRRMAVFSASPSFPDLPSLIDDVVFLPQNATLDANLNITGTLTSQGWGTAGITAVTAAYTPSPADAVIEVNAAAGAVTITLPDATQPGFVAGQRYTVIKTDSSANDVTVTGSAGQKIGGNTSVTLSGTGGYISVVFDGSNWQVWAGYTTVGTAPSGPASGDLGGTYPAPTVTATHLAAALPAAQGGTGVTGSGTPSAGQVLMATSSSAAKWATHPVDWLNVVSEYGADPTGTADSTTAIQNAVNAAGSGGVVYLPAGTYKVTSTITLNANNTAVTIAGDGRWATILSYSGTGDCLRVYDGSTYATRTKYGTSVLGITIDGTGATSSPCGLHYGDILQGRLDVAVQNFTGSGAIGVHLDNQLAWTEQLQGVIYATNCTQHVVFDVSGATTSTGSFIRADLAIYISQQNATFDGVVLQNGAFILNGHLRIRGNFTGSASALTSCVLRITGSAPGGHPASNSLIGSSVLDVGTECSSGAHTPQTVIFGSGPNVITACWGMLDFGAGSAFASSNNSGNGSFVGNINGDATLLPLLNFLTNVGLFGGVNLGTYAAAASLSNGSTISTAALGYSPVTNTGAVTGIILQAGSYDGQLVFVANKGTGSVTFAAASSNVADGSSDVIAVSAGRLFAYDYSASLWYRAA